MFRLLLVRLAHLLLQVENGKEKITYCAKKAKSGKKQEGTNQV